MYEKLFWDYVIDKYIKTNSEQIIEQMDDGIYKYERENDDFVYIFIANMSDKSRNIRVDKENILNENNEKISVGLHKFEPYTYRIFKIKKERK